MIEELRSAIREFVESSGDPAAAVNEVRAALHEISPGGAHPVDFVRWVPIEKVRANDYNPNSVARNEMRLLHTSISHDGYTQPVVTVYDPEKDQYVIVDGFHRYTTMRLNADIRETTGGLLPVVVISKSMNDRMAATVRHNRARGKHSIAGMSEMVFSLLDNGWSDAEVCNELGLEPDELLRLKHVTGFSKLFEGAEYRKSWESRRQIQLRTRYRKQQQEGVKDEG